MDHEENEFTRATGGVTVRLAAACLAATGGFCLLTRIQLTGMVVRGAPTALYAMHAMWILGPAGLALGLSLLRSRLWAAALGEGVALVSLVAMGYWLWFSFANGFVSLMPILAVIASLLAVIATPIAIPAIRRVAAARAKLREEGLDVGF